MLATGLEIGEERMEMGLLCGGGGFCRVDLEVDGLVVGKRGYFAGLGTLVYCFGDFLTVIS